MNDIVGFPLWQLCLGAFVVASGSAVFGLLIGAIFAMDRWDEPRGEGDL